MAVTPEQLDAMEEKRLAEEEDSFEDVPDEESVEERLKAASDLLKKHAILFEFLSDPDYCKALTKRYRELMEMQADRAWDLIEKLDEEPELDDF